jgi:hypothetical protein
MSPETQAKIAAAAQAPHQKTAQARRRRVNDRCERASACGCSLFASAGTMRAGAYALPAFVE